jgi:hypothetical protein
MGWRDGALCTRVAPDVAERVFFGTANAAGASLHKPEDVEYAKNLCGTCQVRGECLLSALGVPERYDRDGIVAGLLPGERKALRVRMKVVVKSTGEEWTGGPAERARPTKTL